VRALPGGAGKGPPLAYRVARYCASARPHSQLALVHLTTLDRGGRTSGRASPVAVSRDEEQRAGSSPESLRVPGAAYLLSQVGAHSSRRWHERLAPLGLDPRAALVLRHVAAEQGRTQASLSASLAVPPSRIVGVVDELEQGGLLERRANVSDRRAHALWLTRKGRHVLEHVMSVSRAHERDLCAGLSEADRHQLIKLLAAVVSEQGLAPGGHPRMSDPPGSRGRTR
jgi:DNA-binding MarR family transcriptional regulator